jgi:hypothetical protein
MIVERDRSRRGASLAAGRLCDGDAAGKEEDGWGRSRSIGESISRRAGMAAMSVERSMASWSVTASGCDEKVGELVGLSSWWA